MRQSRDNLEANNEATARARTEYYPRYRARSTVTIDSEFSEDRINIVLTGEETFKFKEYTPADFPEVSCCCEVVDLTAGTVELVKKQLKAEETGDWSELQPWIDNAMLVDLNKFRRILSIRLSVPLSYGSEDKMSEKQEEITEAEVQRRDKQKCGNKQIVLDCCKKLEERNDLEYAGPNIFGKPTAVTTNAPNSQWAIDRIKLPQAWAIETGSRNVIVGVIDTGISGRHPDLSDNLDDSHPTLHREVNYNYEFAPIDMPTDGSGHGTAVAGIIGARGNVTGVAQHVRLVSLNVSIYTHVFFYWSEHHIVRAINHAQSNNIPILNISGGSFPYTAIGTAIRGYSGLVVASAGNDGINTDLLPHHYPASYTLTESNVISVGATNRNQERWDDPSISRASNYGWNSVDIFAPGEGIYTTSTNNGYGNRSGTSFAAPFVAGVAALIKSYRPSITAARIKEILKDYADPIRITAPVGVWRGSYIGRFLNAEKALNSFNFENPAFFPRVNNNLPYDSSSNPYVVSHPSLLVRLYFGAESHRFILTENINLSAHLWTPIPSFTGTLEGNGKIISNMTIVVPATNYTTEQNFGLFATVSGALLGLTLHNPQIYSSGAQHGGAWVNAGAIAGKFYGVIHEADITGNGVIDLIRVNANVGGIVGDNWGGINASENHVTVAGEGNLGGIVALNRPTAYLSDRSNSRNWGNVFYYFFNNNPRCIGGIVGINEGNASFASNHGYISGMVTITGAAEMGAVIGRNVQGLGAHHSITNTGAWHFNATQGNNTFLFAQNNGMIGRLFP